MEVRLQQKHFIAVEYPGNVINIKNMMKQLGGEKQVYKTLSDSSKRLELHFRPEDVYSKPAYADKFTTTSIVIEVVRRRKKRKENSSMPLNQDERCSVVDESYSANFIGFVGAIYKFKALCDFQLLPLHYNQTGEVEPILSKLVPQGLLPSSWLNEDVPLFVVPLLYSRFDCAQSVYNEGVKVPRKPSERPETSLISTSRPKRASYASFLQYENEDIAYEPRQETLEMLQAYPREIEIKKEIEEFYKERPIWSSSALISKLNLDRHQFRYALASTAYHYSNGPWRNLWIKLGYDPRKNPEAKIYQTLDFRIKPSVTIKTIDQTRTKAFDYYMLPTKSQKSILKSPRINTTHLLQAEKQMCNEDSPNAKIPSYILMAGQLPSTRQCYYQLCDIYIDEVQKLVHQNDGREQFCHEKDGWCEVGVLDKCREIIAKQIEEITAQSVDKQ